MGKMTVLGLPAAGQLLDLIEKRSEEYGGFRKDAARATALCEQLFGIKLGSGVVGKLLLCMKLGRIAEGEITRDSLLDLAGYACILADMLRPLRDQVVAPLEHEGP